MRLLWSPRFFWLFEASRLAVAKSVEYVDTMTKVGSSESVSTIVVWPLILGDTLALLAFGVIGRATHNLATSDVSGVLTTTIPFVVGWFLVAPWLGLFKSEIATSPSRTVVRTLLAWVPLGFPISLILWALLRRRAIPDGIALEFAIAALVATLVFVVGWRLSYALITRNR